MKAVIVEELPLWIYGNLLRARGIDKNKPLLDDMSYSKLSSGVPFGTCVDSKFARFFCLFVHFVTILDGDNTGWRTRTGFTATVSRKTGRVDLKNSKNPENRTKNAIGGRYTLF